MKIIIAFFCIVVLSACSVVQPGEIGVKKTFGKLSKNSYGQGLYYVNPFTSSMERIPTRTVNMEMNLSLPSKEGLNIESNISILYKIQASNVQDFIQTLGPNYETVISSVFRSTAADVCASFMAKDMHSGRRAEIEAAITEKMNEYLAGKSIIIEGVLMKSIKLPPGLYNSIESRLEAEQEVMRMQFVLKKEELEAERKVIEAGGQRDAQKIISDGLTKDVIEIRTIEAFKELATSPNAKVIITDGNSPMLINPESK